MRKPPYASLAVTAGVILLISILVFKSYLPYVGRSLAPKEPPAIVLAMRNAYFVGMGKHGKAWSLKAKTVEIGQTRSITTLTNVTEGKIFDSGKIALQLNAGQAIYDSFTMNLRMDHGINIQAKNGDKLTAEGADWNSTTSVLRSIGRVSLDSKLGRISTEKVEVDLRNKEITLWNGDMSVDLSKEAGQNAL